MQSEDHSPPRWLRVARLIRPQGHRGEILAESLTDFPERLETGCVLSLRPSNTKEPTGTVHIEAVRPHQGRLALRLAECTSMNDAEALRGYELVIPWEERAALLEDEVYIDELIGCVLVDTRSGKVAGTVVDVDRESSSGALLVVEREGGQALVPFVKAWEPRWVLESRTLHMALPDGLLDLDQKG